MVTMGRVTGLEPATSGVTFRCYHLLSYTRHWMLGRRFAGLRMSGVLHGMTCYGGVDGIRTRDLPADNRARYRCATTPYVVIDTRARDTSTRRCDLPMVFSPVPRVSASDAKTAQHGQISRTTCTVSAEAR